MIATAPSGPLTSTLKTSIGFSVHQDFGRAVTEAADVARSRLGASPCKIALLITAGLTGPDPVGSVRSVLGPTGIAGGSASALLTEQGIVRQGALVVALATEGDAATGVAAVPGRDATDAGGRAARIVLAGWPFRLRYPRGLGVAFLGVDAPVPFLDEWREVMGPKMRTVCGTLRQPLYGSCDTSPAVSVACLEASYATGLGYAEGFDAEPEVNASRFIGGAAEAAATALKRLDEHSARLVLVLETAARAATLGDAHADEWARLTHEAGDVPCVGWLCDGVAAYGRGIQPVEDGRALIVAAVGDPPAPVAQ